MSIVNDVRDILELPQKRPEDKSNPSGSGNSSRPRGPPKAARTKRSEGLTRELYGLMGDNAPTIALAMSPKQPKMKDRFKVKTKAVRWEQQPFVNQARKDGLQLRHWAPKKNEDQAQEYKFAAYNVQSNIYSYSSEEYLKFLRDDDWSREETDYLFELCHTYDLRFIVIHDRYDPPTGSSTTKRSVEDLKDRYYTCCRRLIRERPAADETAKNASASSYSFDKNRESARKTYLRSLMARTPKQIAEEEYLYVESRKLEQTYARTTREREDLLRLLGGLGSGAPFPGVLPPGSGLPGQPQRAGSVASTSNTRTKRGRGDDLDTSQASGKGKSKNSLKPDPVFDAQHYITHHDLTPQVTSYGLPKEKNIGPSVHLRSTRNMFVKPNLQNKVTAALTDMGIAERLVMPTKANQDRLEQLSGALAQLVELKANVDRVEYELAVARKRKIREESAMDAEAEEEALVEESNVGLSRQERSVSISSVASSSRPNKRRKR